MTATCDTVRTFVWWPILMLTNQPTNLDRFHFLVSDTCSLRNKLWAKHEPRLTHRTFIRSSMTFCKRALSLRRFSSRCNVTGLILAPFLACMQ